MNRLNEEIRAIQSTIDNIDLDIQYYQELYAQIDDEDRLSELVDIIQKKKTQKTILQQELKERLDEAFYIIYLFFYIFFFNF